MKLSHLADRAGVGRSHFWNVLGGKKSPTIRWLAKIAGTLDVDVDELVARDEPSARPPAKPPRRP